ncbi:MAG: hypothetical protein E7A06_13230 [Clostridiales bacterium]|nr:hypothetical protein [Clostridiales bacterium]
MFVYAQKTIKTKSPLKSKWRFMLAERYYLDGKVNSKGIKIITFSFYDLTNNSFEELLKEVRQALIEKDVSSEENLSMVAEKLKPIYNEQNYIKREMLKIIDTKNKSLDQEIKEIMYQMITNENL